VKGDYFAHETACIDDGSTIGEGTRIWHFCHVMTGARIGARCILGQNVFVAATARVGNNVHIQNNVSLYDGVELEDDVFCGPSCVFTNVVNPRSQVPRKNETLRTLIRRGATIGANATILCGTELGRYSFVAAGAVVARGTHPDYALLMGVPARRVGWVSRHGHRLTRGRGEAGILTCPESKVRYVEEAGVLRCVDLPEDAPLPSE
jgi:UDP-2-acetamido-3-amino-2,3-dideoxy-glucuronate N-acetyltransferase